MKSAFSSENAMFICATRRLSKVTMKMSRATSAIRAQTRQQPALAGAEGVSTGILSASGYTDVCIRQGPICAAKQFNFTTLLVVGLGALAYQRRYCYEHRVDAQAALAK